MERASRSADRIGAALRALRETHTHADGDAAALGAKCLRAVIAQLGAEGVSPADLQPLVDLETQVSKDKTQSPREPQHPASVGHERRHHAPPSATLLARAAAVIDLLVRAGHDESEAAQSVMRRLIASGVPAPSQGGDARGWRRLLEFRNALLHGYGPEEAKLEYRAFSRELEAIPPSERVKRVLDDRLWDRRRTPR